ncbi:restriction endonuclease subunit S [Diaphorobacter sp. MNS-0]|uniref:restriction endonuclease subunit S n=1 Tax=Diaphorobacter sp. MNS-0 TaxID=2866628 RepID=UPI001C73AB48|nr:restriction endonuclease subunit S [Diaphorobacter sp. MNS-0]QYY26915.1 restriction endonuclease subunit S [Diaphorobacter sp. MNS-0]
MLLSNMELIATAPGGVAKLRELILTLAVQGKLVPQDPADEPASVLLQKIRAEKDRLIAEGKIKRDKPLAEIAEEEKPFGLPQGWEWVRLGQLANFIDYRGKTPTKTESGIPLITAKNVRQGFINRLPREFIAEAAYAGWMTRGFPKVGDLLFTTEAPLGNVAAIDIEERFALAQRVICFGLYEPQMSGALSTFLRSPWMQGVFSDQATGVTAQGIKSARLQLIPIPVPPLAEQSRIANRVEALMRLCDALEAKDRLEAAQHAQLVSTLLGTLTASTTPEELAAHWQRVAQHFDLLLDRPEAIDALEQTLLQLAVRGLLVPQDPTDEPASALLQKIRAEKDRLIAEGKIKRDKPLPPITDEEKPFELPVGWEWVRFGDVVSVSSGVTLGRKTPLTKPVSLPYLRVANVQRWRLDLTSMKEVVVDQTELPRYQLQKGDLLITEGGDWDKVGRTAIWRDEITTCLHQNHVFKARGITSDWNAVWAELFLNSAVARSYFASSAKQTTNLASINMTQLKDCAFPVPPLAEQSRIVTRVTALRRLCANLRQRLAERQSVQARLAEALVQEVA